jgi:hypothetical protein
VGCVNRVIICAPDDIGHEKTGLRGRLASRFTLFLIVDGLPHRMLAFSPSQIDLIMPKATNPGS